MLRLGAPDSLRAGGRPVLALGPFLLALLSPSLARADGGLQAVAMFLWFLLATSVGLTLGIVAFIAALRSPTRARSSVAIAIAVVNGVMGGVVLVVYREHPTTLCVFPSLQVALAVIGIPALVAWKLSEPSSDGRDEAPFSRRWLVSWLLGHVAVTAVASVVLMPIQWALLSEDPGNRALEVNIVLTFDGLARGFLLGFVQWLLLRRTLKMSAVWIGLTALASAAAFLAGQQIHNSGHVDDPILGMLARGAIIGAFQWPLLHTRLRGSWRWLLVSVLASLLDWPRAAVYIELPGLTWTVGLVMTALAALASGGLLRWLARTKSDVSPVRV